MGLKDRIRAKLSDYRIPLNEVDSNLPDRIPGTVRTAVIGGGIAGIAAASALGERGGKVDLFEKNNFLGGKVGSWTFPTDSGDLRTEHGFHAFFRQYYNLRDFMNRIGSGKHLTPITDYLVMFERDQRYSFKGLETTPGLNILDMRRRGVYGPSTFVNPFSLPFLQLLRYHPESTFERFDKESFERFARRTFMPAGMQRVFTSFSRAFFSDPSEMSMAELIKSFHFYFLSNDLGLLYDVLDDDFEFSFLQYCRRHLAALDVRLQLGTAVNRIEAQEAGYRINGSSYDYIVLCADVPATRKLIAASPDLHRYEQASEQLQALPSSGRYAVYRLWTDRFEADPDLPCFVFTDRLACLDSISFYHKFEKSSAAWSAEHGGGIFELHSYNIPRELQGEEELKVQLLQELFHYFPELQGMQLVHEYFQYRDDFPGFQTGAHSSRPEIECGIPRLFLAGDWVKMDNPSMLMEAAYTSGVLAANAILRKEGTRMHALASVPYKGLFTRGSTAVKV